MKRNGLFGPQKEMKDQIQVQDLFEASYLLCRGHQISETRVEKGRGSQKIVYFIFEGKEAKGESDKFKMGQAMVNVCMLKVSMTHLKDLLFKRLRDLEIGDKRNVRTFKS